MRLYITLSLLIVGLLVVSCDMNRQARQTPAKKPQTPVATTPAKKTDAPSKNVTPSDTSLSAPHISTPKKNTPSTWWKNIWPSPPSAKKTPSPVSISTMIGKITPAEAVLLVTGVALGIHFLLKFIRK